MTVLFGRRCVGELKMMLRAMVASPSDSRVRAKQVPQTG